MTPSSVEAPVWGAVLLAGGSGRRLAGAAPDKILMSLAGEPVVLWSVRALLAGGPLACIVVVYRDAEQHDQIERLLAEGAIDAAAIHWAKGGPERSDSVRAGLAALPDSVTHVLIHDGARPAVAAGDIANCRRQAEADGAACLARPVTDTIKRVSAPGAWQRQVIEDLDRERLRAMETPQAFEKVGIVAGYRRAAETGGSPTDDAAAWALTGGRVSLVQPTAPNPKLTRPEDIPLLERLLVPKP
ncbi:MAG: IspD/TarI family cytidylyltransferase [Opitutales bacterium]